MSDHEGTPAVLRILRVAVPIIAYVIVFAYLVWLANGARECHRRGGVPVILPTGTQCAAKLP